LLLLPLQLLLLAAGVAALGQLHSFWTLMFSTAEKFTEKIAQRGGVCDCIS